MKLKILHIKEASTNLIHFLSTQYYTSSFFFIFFAASFVTILHVKVRYLFPRVKKKKNTIREWSFTKRFAGINFHETRFFVVVDDDLQLVIVGGLCSRWAWSSVWGDVIVHGLEPKKNGYLAPAGAQNIILIFNNLRVSPY